MSDNGFQYIYNEKMFHAALNGNLSDFFTSLAKGADVHYFPKTKFTPLMASVRRTPGTFWEHIKAPFRNEELMNEAYNKITKELVSRGVELNVKGQLGETALHFAHYDKNYYGTSR